jgi:hypothetical protein
MFPRNVGSYLQVHMELQPRRPIPMVTKCTHEKNNQVSDVRTGSPVVCFTDIVAANMSCNL